MRVILELLRVVFLLLILGVIFTFILGHLYGWVGLETGKFGVIGLLPILIIIFVLYRNILQFSGWYKGQGRKKLPKKVTQLLIYISIALILTPPILNLIFN
jgi:hypothetical protein